MKIILSIALAREREKERKRKEEKRISVKKVYKMQSISWNITVIFSSNRSYQFNSTTTKA
jgi:hypothetical protein